MSETDEPNDPAAALDPVLTALLDSAAGVGGPNERASRSTADPLSNMERREVSSSDALRPAGAQETAALRSAVTLLPSADAKRTADPLDPHHTEFQSIVRHSVVEQIRVHGEENPGIEVCGVLVGTVYENAQASFVYIDAMIRGESSSGRSTQVTFTAETWQHIDRAMDELHPGKKIIGWYHTHPGFGIFLSEMDLFIQRHFFNAAWQVAFVFDPKGQDAGMFAWRSAQVRRVDFVVDDEANGGGAAVAAAAAALPASTVSASASASTSMPMSAHNDPAAPVHAAMVEELVDRVRILEGRVRSMLIGFAILLLVAIIWPLVVNVLMPGSQAVAPAKTSPAPPAKSDQRVGQPDADFPVIPPAR